MTFLRTAFVASLALGLSSCGASVGRTLFGPTLSDDTRGARIASQREYPNVFTGSAPRPPLMTQQEQDAEKKRLEAVRDASRRR